jgi:hypothetical protein
VTFTADNHYDHDTSSSQMSTFFPKTGARKLQKSSYFLNSINYCNIHLHKIISLHITPFCLMIYVLPEFTQSSLFNTDVEHWCFFMTSTTGNPRTSRSRMLSALHNIHKNHYGWNWHQFYNSRPHQAATTIVPHPDYGASLDPRT